MKKNIWSFKLSTAALVLIPAGVAINYIGQTLAQTLKLPLWLDSIGTIISAFLAGPIVGALVGAINNIIYGVTQNPIMFVYALTQVGIGLVAGILMKSGFIKNIGRAIISGLILGFTAVLISTPLNIIFWGGQTGNFWGDSVFTVARTQLHLPVWISSLADEVVVDLPDKIVVAIISYLIFIGLPKTLTTMYDNRTVETFDNETDA
ncbi:MAG: ECF transporter S component [Streptococcaceae bacterium]|jgi:energy-coupling factor transport system substrate-specific component|nr:ECF transporter S component [Streptococcaceae bacterium]